MTTDRRSTAIKDMEELASKIELPVLSEISLGNATERIAVTRWEIEELLQAAEVELRLGPRSVDDLEQAIQAEG